MKKLKAFANQPGAILDAFMPDGQHLGTIMVLQLPPVFEEIRQANWQKQVPVVIVKRALSVKYKGDKQPKGSSGLWADDTLVEVVE